jgi:hypothetical protein
MATDADGLLDRIAEIEHAQAHFRLATDGTDGWVNYIQSQLLEHRQTERAVLTEVIASLQREFEATAKRIVDEAAARHVRGTYDPKNNYDLGDVVALDGGSFMAKRTSPAHAPVRIGSWSQSRGRVASLANEARRGRMRRGSRAGRLIASTSS